jgi:hypothetical protein
MTNNKKNYGKIWHMLAKLKQGKFGVGCGQD